MWCDAKKEVERHYTLFLKQMMVCLDKNDLPAPVGCKSFLIQLGFGALRASYPTKNMNRVHNLRNKKRRPLLWYIRLLVVCNEPSSNANAQTEESCP